MDEFGNVIDSGTTSDFSSQLDSYNADNSSGTVAYNPDTTTQATSGGVVNASTSPLTAVPDASGGNGSFLTPLQGVMTRGLNDAVISATEFGLGSLTDRLYANANAHITPAAAPGVRPIPKNNLYLYLGLAALVAIVLISHHK